MAGGSQALARPPRSGPCLSQPVHKTQKGTVDCRSAQAVEQDDIDRPTARRAVPSLVPSRQGQQSTMHHQASLHRQQAEGLEDLAESDRRLVLSLVHGTLHLFRHRKKVPSCRTRVAGRPDQEATLLPAEFLHHSSHPDRPWYRPRRSERWRLAERGRPSCS